MVQQQIFQANNPARWKRFKWMSRITITIFVFVLAVAVLAVLLDKNPSDVNIAFCTE
jgi:uncharacterized membrane protein